MSDADPSESARLAIGDPLKGGAASELRARWLQLPMLVFFVLGAVWVEMIATYNPVDIFLAF